MKEEFTVKLKSNVDTTLTFRHQEDNLPDGWYLLMGDREFHMDTERIIGSIIHMPVPERERINTLRRKLENITVWGQLRPPTLEDGHYYLNKPKPIDSSVLSALSLMVSNAPSLNTPINT